jgi:Xaa-Pro aminopeptidase
MNELEEKTGRLTRLARESKVGGILLVTQPGFSWLTGGGSNRIDGSREIGNGALFVRADGRRFVIANVIEMPRLLAEELAGGGWEPIDYAWTEEHLHADTLARLARSVSSENAIGADWPLAGATYIERPLARTRALLTQAEVERYRQLGADTGSAIGSLGRSLEPGIEESAIAQMVNVAAGSIGARAVVVLVAADDRIARFRHPVPTAERWKHLVLIATCIQRGGLTVAISRIVSAGKAPDNVSARTRATAEVFGRLLDATTAGAEGRALFTVAQRAYEDAGFKGEEARHHQGGAIGYRSREWVAHPASEEKVQPRQAFAWNPSVTGTKVEDTALLTESGLELITTSPGWPTLERGAADILPI